MVTSKLIKSAIFIVLLIAASCFLGNTCQQIGQLGNTIFSPSWDMVYPFLWLLLALALVAIASGLVAALVRPLWMCFIAFALSSLAVLFIWGLNLISIVLAVIYFLAGLLYSSGVAKGLDERINFSVRPIQDNQTILLIVLIIAASASFYSGCAEQIKNEGFTVPPFITNMVVEIAEGQMEGSMGLTPAEKEQAIAEFREQFEQQMQGWIEPYQQFIPISIAVTLLGFLMTTVTFFSWIPILLLRGIFAILAALHVANVVTETKETKRLTLD